MQFRPLGSTGVQVSAYCLGTAFFGSQTPLEESLRIMERALELGVNFWDTANTYGDTRFTVARPGYPSERPVVEEIVGRALKGRRQEVVLATKVCEPVGPGPNERGLSRRFVMQQCELSLRRLGTDHVDLYYAHHPDPRTPIDETLRAFDDLVRAGKVRYPAISNFAAWQVVEALWAADRAAAARPVCMQMLYNLLDRAAEREQLPLLAKYGMGALAWSPLAGGVLAARYRPGEAPVAGSRGDFWLERETAPHGRPGSVPQRGDANLRKAQALAVWAAARGHTAAQVGLAWLLGNPQLTAVIAGASSIAQLESNVAAADLTLTGADRDEVARVVDAA